MTDVMIFGNSITAYGVIFGLYKDRNVRIHIVSNNRYGMAIFSKYVSSVNIVKHDESEYIKEIVKIIQCIETKPVLMIAGDDIALNLLSNYHNVLEKISFVTFPKSNIVEKVLKKENCYSIAEKLNIPTIETRKINSRDELRKMNENDSFSFPVFIKSNKSKEFSEKYNTKGIICNKFEEVIESYDKYNGFLDECLIQEYLEGDIDSIVAVLLLIDKSGTVQSATVNEKIRAAHTYGSTTLSVSIKNDLLIERGIKIAREIKYYGVLGVQFKYDKKINDYKFLEINGRFSVSAPCAQLEGQNLPLLLINNFSNKKHNINNTKPMDGIWFPIDDSSLLVQRRFYKRPKKFLKPIMDHKLLKIPFYGLDVKPVIFLILLKIREIFK